MRMSSKFIPLIWLPLIISLFKYCKNEDEPKKELQTAFGKLFPDILSLAREPTTTAATIYDLLRPKPLFDITNNLFTENTSNAKPQQKLEVTDATQSSDHEQSNNNSNNNVTPLTSSSAIRIKLNEPFFQGTARLFYGVFSYEVQNIHIIPQHQCFQEGCFSLHTFRITGFQRPRGISLKPLPPNLLLLNIISFDVDILGQLNGNIQLLLTAVPVTGQFVVSARQLTITATFDLQKTQKHVPFLRMQNCELRNGQVNTHVSELGLLTDSINLKYKTEMVEKAKEMITSTICEQIEYLIRTQINSRLRQIPRSISATQILKFLASSNQTAVLASPTITVSSETTRNKSQYSKNLENENSIIHQPKLNLYDYVHPRGLPYAHYYWSRQKRRRRKRQLNQFEQKVMQEQTLILPLAGVPLIFSKDRLRTEQPNNEVFGSGNGISTIQEVTSHSGMKDDFNVLTTKTTTVKAPAPRPLPSFRDPPHHQYRLIVNQTTTKLRKNDTLMNQRQGSLVEEGKIVKSLPSSAMVAGKAVEGSTDYTADLPDQLIEPPIITDKNGGNPDVLLQFLDMNALGRIFLDLDFMDSSASIDSFSVGISGNIFLKHPQPLKFLNDEQGTTLFMKAGSNHSEKSQLNSIELVNYNNQQRKKISLSLEPTHQKTLQILFSEITPNVLLFQAHHARLLKVRIGSKSPIFGNLLKTTCTIDEVCVSDSVPEVGEKYPNELLEIQFETLQPPQLVISKDLATLSLNGVANFFLESSHQMIGQIPFVSTIEIVTHMSTKDPNQLEVNLTITELELMEKLDFFGLPVETLTGFRNAVKGTLENAVKRMLANGIDVRSMTTKLRRYGLESISLNLLNNGIILLQADVDVYQFVFEPSDN